jgi:hypothetical protein
MPSEVAPTAKVGVPKEPPLHVPIPVSAWIVGVGVGAAWLAATGPTTEAQRASPPAIDSLGMNRNFMLLLLISDYPE